MKLEGEIVLKRHVDGRWYLFETSLVGGLDRVLGRPEGYQSFFEAHPLRVLYQKIKKNQQDV
jgi:hypothetical protein